MQGQTVRVVSKVIRYNEEHLYEKTDLEMAASALHYSKYYLHRIFTRTVGLTIHDYTKRRQLTEAVKFLVFSEKPIIEIAFMSGYESQQAFTDIFKAMYKISPSVHPQYRRLGITKLFLNKLAEELLYGKEITVTTYRAGDKADTGWREEYRRLGFAERELLVEYGYPAQRFVLPLQNKEEFPFGDTSMPYPLSGLPSQAW